MKVIVFGATGYIGTHVVKQLLVDNHTVTACVRRKESLMEIEKIGADAFVGDLNELDAIIPQLSKFDAVIWCAQLMLDDESRVMEAFTQALKNTNKILIFTSGTSLLTIRTDGDWDENSFTEDDTFAPRSHIAPRLGIENLVRESAQHGVRGMVIRPSLVWGNGGSVVIADFYHSVRAMGAVCYIGRGLNAYSNVHVEDLAMLYSLALTKGQGGALYHAVSGEVNFRTMCETIAGHLSVPTQSITVSKGIEIWDKFTAAIVLSSCSRTRCPRAREDLGWSGQHLDILEDCMHLKYSLAKDRPLPPWVKPSQ